MDELLSITYGFFSKVNRDPRFDNLCGKFSKEHFDRAYSFVDDIRSREKKVLSFCIENFMKCHYSL